SFAEERTRLRSLLAASPRVTVPANFNAVLNERLAAARKPLLGGWLGPHAFMKFSATAAGLAVLVFVVQFSGLFSRFEQKNTIASHAPPQVQPVPAPARPVPPIGVEAPPNLVGAGPRVSGAMPSRNRQLSRVSRPPLPINAPDDSDFNDNGALLVRMPNSDRDIIVPTVN